MKKTFSKLFAMLLTVALLLSAALSVSAAEELKPVESLKGIAADSITAGDESAAAEFSGTDNVGIFSLKIAKGTDVYNITAFLVKSGGREYILTDSVAAEYAKAGYSLTLMATDGKNYDAACVAYDSNIAFLYASGMNFYTPLTFSQDPFATTVVAGLTYTDDDVTVAKRIEYKAFDFSKWTQMTEFLYAYSDVEMANQWFGCPIFHDTKEYKVQGIGTAVQSGSGDTYIAILNFGGLKLDSTYSLSAIEAGATSGGSDTKSEPGTKNEPTNNTNTNTNTNTDTPDEPEKKGIDVKYLIVGGIVIAAVAYYFYDKNKREKAAAAARAKAEAEAAAAAAALPLDPTIPVEPEATHGVTRPMSDWQIRAQEGPLSGKTFPVSGTMKLGRSSKCDVQFPDNTAGVSGSHCELTVSGDQVILRDLNSTYGTYVSGSRLAPNTDKILFAGDSFRLSENGPAFRLEKVGAAAAQGGIAVRDAHGKVYRSDASGRITFGRSKDNMVRLDESDKSVSSKHCVLYREGGKLYIKDLGSVNGTYFSEKERLKAETPYRVRKGMAFFLSSPKHTYVVIED